MALTTQEQQELEQLRMKKFNAQNKPAPLSMEQMAGQPEPTEGQNVGQMIQSLPQQFIQEAPKQALPGVGSLFGPVGGMAGEVANQALGITEPSLTQIGLAGLGPGVGRLAAGISGRKGLELLNRIGPEEGASLLGKMTPKIPHQTLFQQAAQGGAQLPMTATKKAVDEQLADLSAGAMGEELKAPALRALERLKNLVNTSGGQLDPMSLQRELSDTGRLLRTAEGSKEGAYKQVYKALIKDLDDAAEAAVSGSPQAQALQAARQAFKRQSTVDEIEEAIKDATKYHQGMGGAQQFNAGRVLEAIKKNQFFDTAFEPKEQTEIIRVLEKLNKLPGIGTPPRKPVGSSMVNTLLAVSTGGAAVGSQFGMPGALAGAAAGAALPGTLHTAENIGFALSSSTGRHLLLELLKGSPQGFTERAASVLGAFVASAKAEPSTRMFQPPGVPQ